METEDELPPEDEPPRAAPELYDPPPDGAADGGGPLDAGGGGGGGAATRTVDGVPVDEGGTKFIAPLFDAGSERAVCICWFDVVIC